MPEELLGRIKPVCAAAMSCELEDINCTVYRRIVRPLSSLWLLDCSNGISSRRLIIKQYWPSSSQAVSEISPNIFTQPPESILICLESYAMQQIHRLINRWKHPALNAIKVTAVFPAQRAMLMEWATGSDLATHLLQAHRLRRHSLYTDIIRYCHHAGLWLRTFHQHMPDTNSAQTVSIHDVVQSMMQHIDEKAALINLAEPVIEQLIDTCSNDPVAVLHGDFWPGNVLCQPGDRVATLDTIAYWRGSTFLDLAYFLVHLRTLPLQTYSLGCWHNHDFLTDCESAFLSGYFAGEPPPSEKLAMYQVLILYMRLARHHHVLRQQNPYKRIAKIVKLHWRNIYYRRLLKKYLLAIQI